MEGLLAERVVETTVQTSMGLFHHSPGHVLIQGLSPSSHIQCALMTLFSLSSYSNRTWIILKSRPDLATSLNNTYLSVEGFTVTDMNGNLC